MITTKLLVRVRTPCGDPAVGAIITARLTDAGIDSTGYIDRSHIEASTNDAGVAEIALWPNSTGTSGAEYKVTARGSDGGKLVDTTVTIPDSAAQVWLHDIVMTVPPTPKPYDEESIALIQRARIEASQHAFNAYNARDSAQSYAIEAAASIAVAQALQIQVNDLTNEAIEAAARAIDANSLAQQSALFAGFSEENSSLAAQDSLESAIRSEDAAQQAVGLFENLEAVNVAANAAASRAEEAALSSASSGQSKSQSEAARDAARESAATAQGMASSALLSSSLAGAAATTAEQHKDEAKAKASIAANAAAQASSSKQSAADYAISASRSATTSLNRSAGLIAHAENMRIEIGGHRASTDQALADATSLLGSAEAIDEAVQISYANRAIVDVALSNNLIILSKVKP